MAAMEVFSIPEILEDILLRVACQAKHWILDPEQSPTLLPGHGYQLEPVAALSKASRVCRVFRDTIEGSPKLQRALTGTSDPTLDMLKTPTFLPMKWLVQHALGWTLLPDERLRVWIENLTRYHRNQLEAFLERFGTCSNEASWRKVRACEDSSTRSLEVRVRFRRLRGYEGWSIYWEKIEVGNGATLGTLVDQFSSILYRSGAENVARVVPDMG